MNGHIIKRGKSSFAVVVDLERGADGKRRQQWITIKGTRKQAEEERNRILHEINLGTYVRPANMTVGEYLDDWLEQNARRTVSEKTYERYEGIVRNSLKPSLGHIPLSKLTPSDVLHHNNWLQDEGGVRAGRKALSAQTVVHSHRLLRQALQDAVRLRMIPTNPADAVRPPRVTRTHMRVINGGQAQQLLQLLQGEPLYIPVLLALTTGMRRGEILALSWDAVDLDGDTPRVTVVRSLEQTSGKLQFKEPKTSHGRRTIPIPPTAAVALRKHKAEQAQRRLLMGGAYGEHRLVCSMSDGSLWKPSNLTSQFRGRMRSLGEPFEGLRFHDLRHTHATMLLSQGIPPKVASERLGHSNIAITLDTYSHVLPDMQEAAAAATEKALTLSA